MSRFLGILCWLFPAAIVFFTLWSVWWEPNSLRVTDYSFTLPAEMSAWRGKSVAVIADLHGGAPYITEDKIDKVVDLTLAAKPDIIVLTGDYVIQDVIGGTYMPPETIAAHLKRLDAPLGVYAVLGNHDNWDDKHDIAGAFRRAGIIVLENASMNVRGQHMWIAGLSDLMTTGSKRYGAALRNVPRNQSALCITHEPDSFPEAPDDCRFMIAGHTHGGQMRFPLIGSPIVPSAYGQKYVRGFVTENGRTIFVSTGIGTSRIPVRFNVPPEVSVVRFK